MSKETDASKAMLDVQLQHAVVEHVGTPAGEPGLDEGYYSVFVPSAIRERNVVSAGSPEEAIAKVKQLLSDKIDQYDAEQGTPTGEEVEINPDNMNLTMKTTVRAVAPEEV